MKRTKRGRFIHWGIVLLIYSAIQVYSAKIKELVTETPIELQTSSSANDASTSPNPNMELFFTSERSGTSDYDEQSSTSTTEATKRKHTHPTYRPKRENCTPPAIEQFPQPLMGPNVRRHGGLVLHVLVAIFTFLGLAIVCDDYFVSSLDRICEGKMNSYKILKI